MSVAPGFHARRVYFAIALAVLIADQVTKIAVHARLPGRGPVTIIEGLFNLTYSRNPGGLFGYFGDLGAPWRMLLLTAIPLFAVAMIVGFIARGQDTDRPSLTAFGLILGGAAGNLIDRIFRGYVVDFLDVYVSSPRAAGWLEERFGTAHWPTFNVADSAIVTGACLLALTLFLPQARLQTDPADAGTISDPPTPG